LRRRHLPEERNAKVVSEMANDNQVSIVGNLTDDPELRYTPNGAAVCKFRVAVNRRYKDESGQWKDGDTSYFSVNAWRTLAENVAESLTRGTRVVVSGRLQQRSWETQEGDKRTVIEIEADEIGPSLRWATAKVERQSRGGSGGDWSPKVAVGAGGPDTEETPLDAP
jgi:single-strand DNA-binding protein